MARRGDFILWRATWTKLELSEIRHWNSLNYLATHTYLEVKVTVNRSSWYLDKFCFTICCEVRVTQQSQLHHSSTRTPYSLPLLSVSGISTVLQKPDSQSNISSWKGRHRGVGAANFANRCAISLSRKKYIERIKKSKRSSRTEKQLLLRWALIKAFSSGLFQGSAFVDDDDRFPTLAKYVFTSIMAHTYMIANWRPAVRSTRIYVQWSQFPPSGSEQSSRDSQEEPP